MQVLPFYRFKEQIGYAHPALYNFGMRRPFKVISPSNEFLPFVCQLPSTYTGAVLIEVKSFSDNKTVFNIISTQINHRIFKKGQNRYLVFDGGPVGCMNLDVCGEYYIKIGAFISEVFSAAVELFTLLKFTLSNSKNVAGLPYDADFKQYFYTDGQINPPKFDTFQVSNRDDQGVTTVSYSRITKNYTFDFFRVPPSIQAVFASLQLVERLTVSDIYSEIELDPAQTKIKNSNEENWWADVSLTIPEVDMLTSSYCDRNSYELDTEYVGVSNASYCPPGSLLGIPLSQCKNPFSTIITHCEPEDQALDFIAVVLV